MAVLLPGTRTTLIAMRYQKTAHTAGCLILLLTACFSRVQAQVFPQNELHAAAQASYYKAVFRIPADTMQAWIKRKQVNFRYLSALRPVWAGHKDSIKTMQSLPAGHYAWVSINGHQVQARTETVSRLSYSNITSGKHRLLNVFNATGELPAGGSAFLNDRRLRWNAVNKGYELPRFRKNSPDKLLRIESAGDTLFAWLNKQDDSYYRYHSFRSLPVIRQVLAVPAFIQRVINGEQFDYWESRRERKKAFEGFVVFNKPVYKSNDTLRFKAWLTDKKGRPETKPKEVSVSYRSKNNYKTVSLGQLHAVSAGSYVLDWPLPDSLPVDTRYTLNLDGPSKYSHFSSGFPMEEYELPNITQFSMRPEKNNWLRKDSLKIIIQAKDASDLFIPDGMVELTAITQSISQIHRNAVYVPDTLWQKQVTLSTDHPTEIYIPANQFPEADIKFTLTAVLRNSSNEIKQVSETLEQFTRLRRIDLQRTAGKLHISYLENDTVVQRRALVSISGDELDLDTSFLLPATIPLHPMATEYDVNALDEKGNSLASESIELRSDELSPAVEALTPAGDSIGFRLSNPAELPVWISLMKGKHTVWTRLVTDASYEWKEQVSRRNMYQVRTRFLYNGQEQQRVENLGALYKVLQVNAQVAAGNSPGAKDSLLVEVSDYKSRPVAKANITATAQNLQLKNKFREPALPLQMTYRKQRRYRPISRLEAGDAGIRQDTVTAVFPALASLLGCDTMFYYQRLFSTDPLYVTKTPITSAWPEIALHVYEKGKPLAAYISWLNKQPVEMYWQNDGRPESHTVYPSYIKAAIRLKDRLIEIDSLYMQPNYKHDVFINAGGGPHKNITVKSMPDTLLYIEKQELEKYFIAVEMNYEAKDAWLWNASDYRQLTGNHPIAIAGPFKAGDSIHIFNAGKIDMSFLFEPGYQYRLTQNMARLERKSLLPGKTKLGTPVSTWNMGDTIAHLSLPPALQPDTDRSGTYIVSTAAYQTETGKGMLQLFLQTDSLIRYTILLSADESCNPLVLSGRQTIIHNLLPGAYKVVLVDHYNKAWSSDSLVVKADGVNAYKLFPQRFSANNTDAAYTWQWQMQETRRLADKLRINENKTRDSTPPLQELIPGNASISGQLKDMISGDPITGGIVQIMGTRRVTSTDAKGWFLLNNIPPGEFVLVASSVGYQSTEIKVQAVAGQETQQTLALRISESRLDEVVVVGYGLSLKKNLAGSISSVTNTALQGKAAGVMVQGDPGANASIIIRGASSVNSSTGPVYLIDGVPVDVLPAGLDTSSLSIEILKSSAAVALYGSRAANGAILISTGKNNGPVIRTVFRDYAYWKPNTVTDSRGKAVIPISYPENLTSWQHMVFAAGKKGKYGSSHGVTKIFKPMQAILQVPSVLVSADSISLIGKAINYTSGEKQVGARFNGKETTPGKVSIAPGASQAIYTTLKRR
ncbi:MAG: carboxypeptidase-like regulatory domain-containing protein [Flavihumibacter sp.]